MRDVAIVGAAITKFGELWQQSLRALAVEASLAALKDAGVDHVDALYVGAMSGGLLVGQEHLGALLADALGQSHIAATRVEGACASGGLALRQGFLAVASGAAEVVLVTGVEKMTDVDGVVATDVLATAADQEWEAMHGVTFPGLYAMMARAHMQRFGTSARALASVAAKNHAHGIKNPQAQFALRLTADDVLSSAMVADPLHALECAPISDGAAALVLVPATKAMQLSKRLVVHIAASAQAGDTMMLAGRASLSELAGVARAGALAYQQAGKGPTDIAVCEVHDCFTIAEIMATEALGFFEPGQAAAAVEAGVTSLGGRLPINTSGGLKARGHPVGATGVAQAVEIVTQLRGEAGARQVAGARVGMTQNMGGTGATAVVHILEVR